MVTALDDGGVALVALLKELELSEDTMVIFLSDNGGPTPANASDNSPLRATKGTVYEGGIRVPFLLAWPRTLPAGGEFHHPVSALDIVPTAVAVAGLEPSPGLDGVNLMPHLTGQRLEPPRETLYWYSQRGAQYAARTPDRGWAAMTGPHPVVAAMHAVALLGLLLGCSGPYDPFRGHGPPEALVDDSKYPYIGAETPWDLRFFYEHSERLTKRRGQRQMLETVRGRPEEAVRLAEEQLAANPALPTNTWGECRGLACPA